MAVAACIAQDYCPLFEKVLIWIKLYCNVFFYAENSNNRKPNYRRSTMYQKILIATDGSTLSKKAVTSGLELAALTGASIIALKVVPRYPVSYFEGGIALSVNNIAGVEKQWADAAMAVVKKVQAAAEAEGIKAKAVTVSSDFTAEAIVIAAKKYKCDLIVMASHGRRGMKRLLMGSETMHVLTHSHIPVLVLR